MISSTIKQLCRDRALAPGGQADRVVDAFLPLVQGTAAALLPDRPESVSGVVEAVFDCFALRWRKLPRKTVVASWLLRTTWFAVQREYRLLRSRGRLEGAEQGVVLNRHGRH
jgi:hypothetical protein